MTERPSWSISRRVTVFRRQFCDVKRDHRHSRQHGWGNVLVKCMDCGAVELDRRFRRG